jgi:hypothetical protein
MQPGPQDKCDVTSPVQSRACLAKNIQTSRKAIDRKIAEACKKQVMSGGKPAKGNEILACRADRLAKIADGIN